MLMVHTLHHFGAPNGPATKINYDGNDKNLYDRFLRRSAPNSDPAGLFDYSKGSVFRIDSNYISMDGSAIVVAAAGDYTGRPRKF